MADARPSFSCDKCDGVTEDSECILYSKLEGLDGV